jgi:hypothetical protein
MIEISIFEEEICKVFAKNPIQKPNKRKVTSLLHVFFLNEQ